MPITQFYKSRFLIGNNAFPVPPNGAALNWPASLQIPIYAGNYWQFNYIEGLQFPQLDLTLGCLDGEADSCPLHANWLQNYFMERSTDYQHDTNPVSDVTFFDGYSGFAFDRAKFNSFQIAGSKGDDVTFRANAMIFDPRLVAGQKGYDEITSITNSVGFTGAPIRFQSLSFYKNLAIDAGNGSAPFDHAIAGFNDSNCLNGVVSFNVSYTNNVTADVSMDCGSVADSDGYYQSTLPVDANAGIMGASGVFTFQSHNENAINNGDSVTIVIRQGAIATAITFPNIAIDTKRNRAIGSGRQMRTYQFTGLGDDGVGVPPLIITPA